MTNLVTAVTGLRFIKTISDDGKLTERYLFAAIGNQVQVFIDEAHEPSAIEEIFPTEYRIHGFSDVVKNRMVVYGGRVVALVNVAFSTGDVRIALLERTEFDDWVWGVHWLNSGRMIAVTCGHSTTYICDAEDLENSFKLQSEEKELTWSSNLFTTSHGLRVVAGSSFGDVLSWTLLKPIQLESAETYLLSKHHNTKPAYDKLLPVHRLCAHDGPVMHLAITSDSQRMATASVDRTVRVWTTQQSDCTACAGGCFTPLLVHYGHLARVWDVSFITHDSVVSVGEDHSCRVWGDTPGREIACYRGHAGRNIWSVAVCDGLVATGGEDGGVKVRPLSTAVTSGPFLLPRCENPRKRGLFNEGGRCIVMLDGETLLLTTDFGRILQGRVGYTMEWTEVFRDDRGRAFTPCSLAVCGELVLAGQTDGNVVMLRDGQRMQDLQGEGMVMGLFAAAGTAGCDVLIAAANGVLSHWLIGDDVRELGKYRMERSVKTSLVTAACIARDASLVITGDRGGRVMTYPLLTRPCNSTVHPGCIIRPHKDRVSSLSYTAGTILTSGFDGAVATLGVCEGCVEVRSVARAPDRMDTITKHAQGRVVAFRGSTAVLWDVRTRREYIRADVGNWRRAHDVFMGGRGCAIGYWRGGGAYVTRGGDAGWGRAGGHGGRVWGVAIVDGGIVTGGEDGVCVWRGGAVVQRLVGHTSCVHAVAARGGLVVSVGGKDEVFAWECRDGVWREAWRSVCAVGAGGVVERALCVGFGEGVVVGRSDGSVVSADSGGVVVGRVGGGALCMDCAPGWVVVGDTRGVVSVMSSARVEAVSAHRGGVNDVKIVGRGWVSAGDDGSVCYYEKRNGDNRNAGWARVWRGVRHTAGVTGLALGRGVVYSVGTDQRLVSWALSRDCRTSTTKISVVDASSIAHRSGQLVIGGIGLQWLHV